MVISNPIINKIANKSFDKQVGPNASSILTNTG